jgi:DNA-binding MarR family transcriptional regulator
MTSSTPDPTPPPLDIAELSHDFRLANARLARRLRQEKSVNDVTDSQFSALGAVYMAGSLTLGQLSEHERVTPPSMNRTVNNLVDAGLVARAGSPEDGRKVLLSVTEAGRILVEETRRRRDAWLAHRVLTLPASEQQVLTAATAIMKKLADS